MDKLTAEGSLHQAGVLMEDFISSSTYAGCVAAIESHTKELQEQIAQLKAINKELLESWNSVSEGEYSVSIIQKWLIEDMAPAIDKVRKSLT